MNQIRPFFDRYNIDIMLINYSNKIIFKLENFNLFNR